MPDSAVSSKTVFSQSVVISEPLVLLELKAEITFSFLQWEVDVLNLKTQYAAFLSCVASLVFYFTGFHCYSTPKQITQPAL